MRELQMQQLKMTKDALPIGGCLPMLLQFPLLFAFYTAITVVARCTAGVVHVDARPLGGGPVAPA